MSFTRFSYDNARVKKNLQEATDPGRYMLSVPGPADRTKYIESPFIRLQGFGNNNRTNSTNIESDLRGLTRNLNRDNIEINDYLKKEVHSKNIDYGSNGVNWTEQTNVTHPSWLYRGKKQYEPNYLFFDPQENVNKPFLNNLSTRILEKDHYKEKKFKTRF